MPFGLVRFGVAPDHPEVKAVANDFNTVLSDPRVRFIGNTEIGRHVRLSELMAHYDATVLAYGSQSERTLAIKGRHLANIAPARSFVNWYNGHPDHQSDKLMLTDSETDNAIIIGQGNVAIDCARMLLAPLESLSVTDITPQALQSLSNSTVRNVHLIGRRGPAQSAFTTAEFREITGIANIETVIDKAAVSETETGPSANEIANSRPKKRKLALIKEVASQPRLHTSTKKLFFDFFLSPVEYIESPTKAGYVGGVRFERMTLRQVDGSSDTESVGTDQYVDIPASLVLESIGYRSQSIDPMLPFNSRSHTVSSTKGRVDRLPTVYVSGWLKRGPTGIIGSNISDARETVTSIVEDLADGERATNHCDNDLVDTLRQRGHRIVDSAGWRRIDEHELATGRAANKNRLKLTAVNEMLRVAGV